MIKKYIKNNKKFLFFISLFMIFYGFYIKYMYDMQYFQTRINNLSSQVDVNRIFPIVFNKEGIDNIVLVMRTKNESDIILENLVWHFAIGFRKFIIVDNSSTDNTGALIQKFADLTRKNADVFIIKDPIISQIQSRITTGIYNFAGTIWGEEIDWIFPVDSDEFWTPEYNLKAILDKVPKNIDAISTLKFIYNPGMNYHDYDKDEKFYNTINLREKKIAPRLTIRAKNPKHYINYKVALKAHKDIMINLGNHSANYMDKDPDAAYRKYYYTNDLKFIGGNIIGLHMREFPIRSPEQVHSKFSNMINAFRESILKDQISNKRLAPHALQYMEYEEKYGDNAGTVRFNEGLVSDDESVRDPMPFDEAFKLFYQIIE